MKKLASFRVVGFVAAALLAPACGNDAATESSTTGGGPASGGTTASGGTDAQAGSAATAGVDAVGGSGTAGTVGSAGTATGGNVGSAGDAAGGDGAGGAPDLGRPNIVIVLLDDMGFSDLGAYGGEIRTPNIDNLAKTGTRFRNYYVTPRCSPTREALMTGLYTQQVAVTPGASLPPLRSDNNVTIPEMLSAAGYRTYMAGKWHLGEAADQVPRARGFDHAFGFGPQAAGAEESKWDKTKYGFVSKGNAIAPHVYGDGPKDFYQATAIGDYALDYLNYHYAQKDNAPFFMYLAFNAPHFPIQVDSALADTAPAAGGQSYIDIYSKGWAQVRTDRYARMLAQGVIDSTFLLTPAEPFMTPTQTIPVWATLGDPQKADLTRKMALLAACIESVDATVGRVVAHLKSIGQFENTLIFVQSDNGGNYEGGVVGTAFGAPAALTGQQLQDMGQPNQQTDHVQVGGGWAHVENTPFRFYKHYTHGGGVRSPLVVSWPAHTATPGAWKDQVAHAIDLAPTILEAAGATHPDTFAGHAVLPLEGASLVKTIVDGQPIGARQLGFEHETNRAWIDGNFKMVVRHENADTVELYDLSKDPTELNDLAASMPARATSMVKAWNAWAKRVGVPAARQLLVP